MYFGTPLLTLRGKCTLHLQSEIVMKGGCFSKTYVPKYQTTYEIRNVRLLTRMCRIPGPTVTSDDFVYLRMLAVSHTSGSVKVKYEMERVWQEYLVT
jgi:hypothetical protein